MKDPREFFPGDPPLGEWIIGLLAVVGILCFIGLLGALVVRNSAAVRKLGFAMLVALAPVAWFAVERHTGPWKALQTRLIEFEAEARNVLRTCDHDRDCAVRYFDAVHGTSTFQFTPEHRPVRLYLRGLEGRLVGVDFGHGANAEFDATWMITLYSD